MKITLLNSVHMLWLALSFSYLHGAHQEYYTENKTVFSGHVAKINRKAQLMRVRADFPNMKYLRKNDRIFFWDQRSSVKRCQGKVIGISHRYLLLKIEHFTSCDKNVQFTVGSYLFFDSQDMKKNIAVGSELVAILKKKRLAVEAKLTRHKNYLETYMEKVEAVNQRYEVLKQKLDIEWQNELSLLEKDRLKNYEQFKNTEARLYELDHKLQQYRLEDENLQLDRWSLDPELYYKR